MASSRPASSAQGAIAVCISAVALLAANCGCLQEPPRPMPTNCSVYVSPVLASGEALLLDPWAPIWLPLVSPTTAGGRLLNDDCLELLCRGDEPGCYAAGECGGIAGGMLTGPSWFGALDVRPDVAADLRWFGLLKVPGYQSVLTPLLACAERYDPDLILDVTIDPLEGPIELCEDAPTMTPAPSMACDVAVDVVDPGGAPIANVEYVQVDGMTGQAAVVEAAAGRLNFDAVLSDGTDAFHSFLVHAPGYSPSFICVPCSADSAWNLDPLPPLEEIPPPGD